MAPGKFKDTFFARCKSPRGYRGFYVHNVGVLLSGISVFREALEAIGMKHNLFFMLPANLVNEIEYMILGRFRSSFDLVLIFATPPKPSVEYDRDIGHRISASYNYVSMLFMGKVNYITKEEKKMSYGFLRWRGFEKDFHEYAMSMLSKFNIFTLRLDVFKKVFEWEMEKEKREKIREEKEERRRVYFEWALEKSIDLNRELYNIDVEDIASRSLEGDIFDYLIFVGPRQRVFGVGTAVLNIPREEEEKIKPSDLSFLAESQYIVENILSTYLTPKKQSSTGGH